MVNNNCMADEEKQIYYNEFFEGEPMLSKEDRETWEKEVKRQKKTFAERPCVNNLTRRNIWEDRAKFYFLPFMINCYQFTRQHRLPYFAIPVSPTCMFYRDRLHLRNYMDTVHQAFFKCLDMCLKKGEKIMLLVEKRFHIEDPIDGGSQQLYNMLWDVDLSILKGDERIYNPPKVILPPEGAQYPKPRMGVTDQESLPDTSWGKGELNPDIPQFGGVDLCRRTLWFQDDLNFLCKKYYLMDECKCFPEILDLEKYPEEKRDIYAKTAREFYFKIFEPKEVEDDDDTEVISSDSDLDDDDFDIDSTDIGLLDSTLDFEEDDKEMNKIIAFFAKMPKVTGLVQGMLDMMTSLTRVLPLVAVKIEDPKLKESLGKTVEIINLGIGKVLKICAYLGIKVQKKPNGAIGEIVKNRFKKDKKDFLEYEIDELNKSLDALENVDEEPPKPPKGQIPLDVKPSHLYPQRMPLGPHPPTPIVVPPPPPPVDVKPEPPPKPPKPEPPVDSSGTAIKPPPPPPIPIPSVKPEPPKQPPKGENGIK